MQLSLLPSLTVLKAWSVVMLMSLHRILFEQGMEGRCVGELQLNLLLRIRIYRARMLLKYTSRFDEILELVNQATQLAQALVTSANLPTQYGPDR